MVLYVARRLAYAALTGWIAVTLAFCALRLLPGDAIAAQLSGSGATEAQIAARREALGLNRSPVTQYVEALVGLVQGNMGVSLSSGRPVGEMIGEQIGSTLVLTAGGIVLGTMLGLLLGVVAGTGGWRAIRTMAGLIAALTVSSPVYWTGTLLIYLFSVHLRWLPSTGNGTELRFLLLPWLVLSLGIGGAVARLMAAGLADVRAAEFVRTARAKGLRERRVVWLHMLRPVLSPVLTLVGLQFAFLFTGAIVTEMLFVRRGIGQVLITAVNEHDFPVVQGVVVVSAIVYSLVSAVADASAALIDPRIRSVA